MAGLVKSDSGKSRSLATVRKSVRRVIWDKSVFDTLVSHVGPMKMEASLGMFRASLTQNALTLRDEGFDNRRRRYDIHDLASVSGFLGFIRLFDACVEILAGENSVSISKNAVVSEIRTALREVNRHITTASKRKRSSVAASSDLDALGRPS